MNKRLRTALAGSYWLRIPKGLDQMDDQTIVWTVRILAAKESGRAMTVREVEEETGWSHGKAQEVMALLNDWTDRVGARQKPEPKLIQEKKQERSAPPTPIARPVMQAKPVPPPVIHQEPTPAIQPSAPVVLPPEPVAPVASTSLSPEQIRRLPERFVPGLAEEKVISEPGIGYIRLVPMPGTKPVAPPVQPPPAEPPAPPIEGELLPAKQEGNQLLQEVSGFLTNAVKPPPPLEEILSEKDLEIVSTVLGIKDTFNLQKMTFEELRFTKGIGESTARRLQRQMEDKGVYLGQNTFLQRMVQRYAKQT